MHSKLSVSLLHFVSFFYFPTSNSKNLLISRGAKERKIRIWKNYVPKTPEIPIDQKNFTGKVIQIVQPDSIAVKTSDDKVKTIHLASVRPPR